MNNRILHLERKFTSPTETFIVNQINTTPHFQHSVFTLKHLNNLTAHAEVISVPHTPGALELKVLGNKSIRFLKEQFEKIKPSLIHAHFLTDARYFHPLTKKYSVPKICSCYGYDVSRFPNMYGWFSRQYIKKVFAEYDLFLAMSEDMKKDLLELGCPASKIRIHYHGIKTSNFRITRSYEISDTFNLLTIGSLVPKKGHMTVLQALAKIVASNPDIPINYTIVGTGRLKKLLENFVQENHLSSVVDFRGSVPHGEEFNKILKEAHVFLHPSMTTTKGDKEGIPGTIVEAMASGLPVITTYHAGIPSVIKNNFNGLLVKEKDFSTIGDHLLALFKNETLRKEIGTNAAQYSEVLDINKKSVDLEEIYTTMISRR